LRPDYCGFLAVFADEPQRNGRCHQGTAESARIGCSFLLTMGSSCLYSAQLESTSDICVRHFEVPSLIPRPVFHK
jgi:hypothetical protein